MSEYKMSEYKIISIESTTETYIYKDKIIPIKKITTYNGNIYAWISDKDVGIDWTCIPFYDDNIEIESYYPIPYNIQIIHNSYKQPMININKGNQQILRQEVNRWEFRNLEKWCIDE